MVVWLWTVYLAALAAHPLAVKSLTSACLSAASDAIAQRLLGASRLAWRRCTLMALFGLAWYGPSNHVWQGVLMSLFPPQPGLFPSALRLIKRVCLDQLAYAPLNNCLMIAYVGAVCDGKGWAAARRKVVAELPAVQRRGWRVWPAVQLVNQSVVPVELRVLCNNVVAVCWTSFVILRARSARSAKRLPVFNMRTGMITAR